MHLDDRQSPRTLKAGVLLVEVGDGLSGAGRVDYPADHLRLPVVGEPLAGELKVQAVGRA